MDRMSVGHYCRCGHLIESGQGCPSCKRPSKRQRDRQTYDYRWEKLSKYYRRMHPICERCDDAGRTTPSDHVHHVVPVLIDPSRKYDLANLVALCQACHTEIHREIDSPRGETNVGGWDFMGNPSTPKPVEIRYE